MATAEFELDQFAKDNLIAWNITTQCLNQLTVEIFSGKERIGYAEKTTASIQLQKIALDNKVITNNGPIKLRVSIPASNDIKSSIVHGAISDKRARKVGYIYDICLEDQYDNDYNDVYINIVGWKNFEKNSI